MDDYILSRDILATLECDPRLKQAAEPMEPPREAQPPPLPGRAEERLRRIEALHEKGLLSDEEYRSLRKRVLETL